MKKQVGFTLIEMILVIGVIAILVGFVIATLDPFSQFQKGQDSRRKSDLSQIQKALEQYYQDHDQYPPSSGNSGANSYEIEDTSTSPATDIPWGGTTAVWQKYIEVLPKDPDPTKTYIYVTDATFQTYWIYASLDRGSKDPDACAGGNCQNVPSNNKSLCGGSGCNFGLSSPNTNP